MERVLQININFELLSYFAAFWGAIVSTILAVIKIYSSRFKMDTYYSFISHYSEGDLIILRNLNNKPITVEYWDVMQKDKPLISKLVSITSSDHLYEGDEIAAHSSLKLRFTDGYFFDAMSYLSRHKDLYIKLIIAGRKRPIKLKIASGY